MDVYKVTHCVRFIGIFLLCGIITEVRGQSVIGARELAVGQATSALQGTDWAMFGNPAMMPLDEKSVSFFGVRYFGLRRAHRYGRFGNLSHKNWGFGRRCPSLRV
ncbi:MAG: hypothetical protein U5J63_16435 [Fodinibius sp.]|nr:hypothetical protein [Fodinibius sp.]